MTDASKDVLISAKNKRIKDLEAENKRLKEELMRLRGKIYDNSGGKSLTNKIEYHKQLQDGIDEMEAAVERLREEIQQLMSQKEELINEF